MNCNEYLMTWFVDIFHSLVRPPEKHYFSTWNCFHTAVRGSVGTYSAPRLRIRYS